jgi:hypothetical protein
VTTPPLPADLEQALAALQRIVVKHPIAAQALYGALIREGRAYAETEEGRLLREELLRSETVTRIRSVWEIVTFGALKDAASGGIPSALLEALARSAVESCFESRVFRALESTPSESAP